MIKYCLLVIILVILAQSTFGQERQDSIQLIKNRWGYLIPGYQGKKISSFHPFRDYRQIMKYDPEAIKYLKRSKRFMIAGIAVEEVGLIAFLIFETNRAPVNSASYGSIDPNIIPFAIVTGFAMSPFIIQSGKNTVKAINTYNGNLHKTGLRRIKPEYYFRFTGNTLGLAMKF